jgi:hypothetical protein
MAKVLRVVLPIVALSCGACGAWFGWVVWITSPELEAHLRIIRAVDSQMGFKYGTPYVNGVEVFVIEEVTAGGVMDRAGLRVGDHPDCSIASLYETMVFGQGREVEIPVTREDKPVVVRVPVPELVLQDDPRDLHWYFLKHRESEGDRPTLRCR